MRASTRPRTAGTRWTLTTRPNKVAERANVHTDTIRKLVTSGRIESVKFGSSLRISESAFNRYVEQFKSTKPLPQKRVVAQSKCRKVVGFKFL